MKRNVTNKLMEALAEMVAHTKGEAPELVTHTVMVPTILIEYQLSSKASSGIRLG